MFPVNIISNVCLVVFSEQGWQSGRRVPFRVKTLSFHRDIRHHSRWEYHYEIHMNRCIKEIFHSDFKLFTGFYVQKFRDLASKVHGKFLLHNFIIGEAISVLICPSMLFSIKWVRDWPFHVRFLPLAMHVLSGAHNILAFPYIEEWSSNGWCSARRWGTFIERATTISKHPSTSSGFCWESHIYKLHGFCFLRWQKRTSLTSQGDHCEDVKGHKQEFNAITNCHVDASTETIAPAPKEDDGDWQWRP